MADQSLQALIKSRGGKLGVCTRKMNEIKILMDAHADDETINERFDELRRAMNEFYDAHVSAQACMTEEEKEKDKTEWYEPKMAVFDTFCTEIDEWKKGKSDTQPEINPEDSVSKTGSKTSKVSAVSSLRAKAAAEKAALEAKSRGMKLQHELQKEKEELQRKMEQLDLDIQLSEADAKLQVYESFEMASTEQLQYSHDILQPLQGDAMNAYAESYPDKSVVMPEQSPVEFTRLGAIPKTPLQRMMKEEAKQKHMKITSQTNNMPTETAVSTTGQTTTQMPIQQPTPVPRTAPRQRTTQTPLLSQAPAIINVNQPSLSSHRMEQPNTPPVTQPLVPQPNDSQRAQPNQSSNPVNAQSELANLIIQHQKQTSLPTRELPTFNGDLISYLPFIHAFENRIEQMTASHQERLFYLEQYTTGQPKELVQSCLHMNAQLGYAEARRLLDEHFGDPYRLSTAYIQKALNWNAIKPEDGKELFSYALYLRSCCNIISSLPDMSELDTPSNLQLILSKLPYKLRERWRSKAYEIQEQTKRRARFHNIVDFLEKQAKVLLDPVFGTIQDSVSRAAKPTGQIRPPPKKNFATTVVPVAPAATPRGGNTSDSLQQKHSQMAYSKPCLFCKGDHTMESCHQMALQQHKEKVEFLKKHGMCFACLTKGHVSSGCTRRLTCRMCQKKHPTILHIEGPVRPHSLPQATNASPVTQSACTINNTPDTASTDTGAGVYDCKLAIIPVKIKSIKSNNTILTYAFLDPGSSASFCTQKLLEDLHMQGKNTEILLRTMGQERVIKTQRVTGLEVSSCNESDFIQLPEVFTQDRIPVCHGNITKEEDVQKWAYLKDVQLPAIDADIGLLIGANAPWAHEPWSVIHSQGDGPAAVKCRLGWFVQGPLHGGALTDEHSRQCVSTNRISVARLEELLVRQYNQDFPERTCQEQTELSFEDKRFLKIADESATKKDGHYEMRLPFRVEKLVMPNNKPVAELRAATLLNKLKRNEDFRTDYTTFMNGMLENEYAEKVPDDQLSRSDGRVWYIPHHAVYHKKKKKIRVVFDCTASFQGTSLNLQLLQGPDLTNTLLGVILRFRQEQVAMMADIESMFYQVRVPSNDVDFLRFLWWPNGDVHQPLAEYRMAVHLFGAVSSPSCANYALKRTAKDNEGVMNPEVLETIKKNFYVDDLLKSVASEEQAIRLIRDLKTTCATGGFKLTKWVSSSQAVLASIPEEDRASKEIKDVNLEKSETPLERALGIQWNISSDTLCFKISPKQQPCTRRGILSIVNSLYDPLGFLTPMVLPAKRIIQELCRSNLGWDSEIPVSLAKRWETWVRALGQLEDLNISRCYKPKDFSNMYKAQLHHFCDASEVGYGTVSYLRLTDSRGLTHVAFMMGKGRVAPLKPVTIPRLELAAAVLAVRINSMLERELELTLEAPIYWTDSTTVIKYILNDTSRFQTYVAN